MTPGERHRQLGQHGLRAADRAARRRRTSSRPPSGWACGAARASASPAPRCSPTLSAVLGTNEVNTLEMAAAYGTLATGGQHVDPSPSISVTDAQGQRDLAGPRRNPSRSSIPKIASVADDILQKVVLYGTGTRGRSSAARRSARPAPADTHTNAWFVGAIPQLTAAVWVGFREGMIPMEPPTTRITGLRRHVARTDLAAVHGARPPRGCPFATSPRPRSATCRSPSTSPRIRTACRTAYTLPPEHRHPRVHLRHAAHEDVHHADQGPVRGGALGDRHGSGIGRGRARSAPGSTWRSRWPPRPSRRHGDLSDTRRPGPRPSRPARSRSRSPEPESERLAFGPRSARREPLADPASPSTRTRSPRSTNRQSLSSPTLTPTRCPRRSASAATGSPASIHTS